MFAHRAYQVLALVIVTLLVIAACGEAAAPTAAPVPTATAGSTDGAPIPTAAAKSDMPVPSGTGYPPEKAKELLAQNMFLPSMSFGDGETPQYGGTANFSNKAELPNDDPTLTSSITMINILGSLHGNGGLVGTKRRTNAEPRPVLSESWTASDDFKVWTFKIRPGVKWHDGDALTAEDVKFSYDLAMWPPKGRRVGNIAADFAALVEVKVIDSMTLQLVLNESSPHLLETLSAPTNEVIHKRSLAQKEIEKGNVTLGMAPLGWISLGPYKYDNYVRGSTFRSVRFDGYWEKDEAGRALPYLDAVQFTPIPDRAVALGAFRAGRLEAMSRGVGTSLDPDQMALILRSLPGKVWFHRYPYLAYGIAMNAVKAPFSDVRARKAVNLYMDRDEGAKKMQGGFAFSSGFLSPASWWHSGAYATWPGYMKDTKAQDQAEAKRLMQEAGLVGTKVSISCRADFLYMCEFSESVLRGVGFEPNIELLDVNAVRQVTENMQHQTYMAGPANGLVPGTALAGRVSTNTRSGNKTDDMKIDDYQRIILTSTDPLVRRRALWESERYVLLDMAYNASFLREEVVAPYRTYLKGSIVSGYQAHDLTDRATDWIDKSLK